MKIGLFTALFFDKSLEEALDIVADCGIEAVEFGVGAYPGAAHLNVKKLIGDKAERKKLMTAVESRGLMISALSCHGNPLHPVAKIAKEHHQAFLDGVELASLLGVSCLNGFSGCPGDGPRAVNPNWVTCAWPDEYRDILVWQWKEKVVPYWTEQAALLKRKKVKFCIEMHPGFVVYNPESLLRLRHEVGKNGDAIGANFDPSHLWWQGIDPIAAVRFLGDAGAVYHVHAKDTRIDPFNCAINGNLDTKSYADILNRSWVFRSVGYGHDESWWKGFISMLRTVGYDYVLSIEHEDGLMSSMEGLTKAVDMLSRCVISEPVGKMFWAKE
ncbi:MAG: TIM barrel protein [Fimbriimonadia bacterium]|jgi:sugar phosphate isomerase/epimerase